MHLPRDLQTPLVRTCLQTVINMLPIMHQYQNLPGARVARVNDWKEPGQTVFRVHKSDVFPQAFQLYITKEGIEEVLREYGTAVEYDSMSGWFTCYV